jgi:hypothetical protein
MTTVDSYTVGNASQEWKTLKPTVNAEAEFYEITNDFGNPLEILREAISNSIDAKATEMYIEFRVENVEGARRSVIRIADNGLGMAEEVLGRDFWGLGFSRSRGRVEAIGEKGHGTKIFLRSEKVTVRTQGTDGAFESICERPLSALSRHTLHEPKLRAINPFQDYSGTEIEIIGYNDNERSKFVKDVVKDYLLWFTKVGSIERTFGIETYKDFKVFIKCLDQIDYEKIDFGHFFPEENDNIEALFDDLGTAAADRYVKRYVWNDRRLESHPEVTFQVVVSVEGDEVKRSYNPMIRARRQVDKGRYRVSDRYGLWVCKDFIPINRVNEWVTGFGSGSNAFVLLHAFVNCQELKLTANRGTIANTDPEILEELQSSVQDLISKVDADLHTNGLYTLRGWQEEHRTLRQEEAEFKRRLKNLSQRKVARLDERLLVEPQNESELFGLFITIYTLRPDIFEFEPLDYNTSRGIDIIARNKSNRSLAEGEHWYIELKYSLRTDFNHAFQHIRWIVCWDFDKSVGAGSEFHGVEDGDNRRLVVETDEEGRNLYFLDNARRATKIQILRLKEMLKDKLDMEFNVEATR